MLKIKDLKISFSGDYGSDAVRSVSLEMARGDSLSLVGESGSGKTVTALSVAGLIDRRRAEISGEVLFNGKNLLTMQRSDLRKIQGKDIGVVFQEPRRSLNPLMKVGAQVEEPLKIHTALNKTQRKSIALEYMRRVELSSPEEIYNKYPHQLSGGQCQRISIAAAIILEPKLLIADEPTTALDVTVQSRILKLLKDTNKKHGVGILFITHDLSAAAKLCEHVAVMHQGEIVETGTTDEVWKNPKDDYTKRLISAIPTRKRINTALMEDNVMDESSKIYLKPYGKERVSN